jgi:hypothetical protein
MTQSIRAYANNNDAYVPEMWAQETLMILESRMVATQLVHRDFEPEVARVGDLVNTRRPATFSAKRKVDGDAVTVQDATATNIQVPMDQHLHTTFIIYDGEGSKSFKQLVNEYLAPAASSLAEAADQVVLGQVYQALAYQVGKIGTSIGVSTVVAARQMLETNRVPGNMRSMIVTPAQEAALLNLEAFTSAEKIGDEGTALREGSIGRKYGFNIYACQNAPTISGVSYVSGAINFAAGYAAGTTALTVDGFSAAIANGSWCTIDGKAYRITGTTGGATPTALAIADGLVDAVADNAVIRVYAVGAINLAAGYAAGYNKAIAYDTAGYTLKKGQLVSDASGNKYSILDTPSSTQMFLERSLAAAVADDAVLGLGPNGDFGMAFHKNAIAFVNRPLATPAAAVRTAVMNFNGISVRVTMDYDSQYQGTRVTLDMLCGVKVLDSRMIAPVVS